MMAESKSGTMSGMGTLGLGQVQEEAGHGRLQSLSPRPPAEKSNVLTAIKGESTTQAVVKALREQWSDSDLAKRDKYKAGSALLAMDESVVEEKLYSAEFSKEY